MLTIAYGKDQNSDRLQRTAQSSATPAKVSQFGNWVFTRRNSLVTL